MLNLQKTRFELDAAVAAFVDSLVAILPQPTPRRSLLDRPNVVVFRSNAMPVALTVLTPQPSSPQGPSLEDLADSVSKAVLSSAMPLTFEQLRVRVRVTKDTLTPVLEQLLAENKLRVIEVDGVLAYKLPRLEPIRRRRMTA